MLMCVIDKLTNTTGFSQIVVLLVFFVTTLCTNIILVVV